MNKIKKALNEFNKHSKSYLIIVKYGKHKNSKLSKFYCKRISKDKNSEWTELDGRKKI